MTTLETIIAELGRQHEASRGSGLGCFSAKYPNDALIDGHVDLVALAAAIDKDLVARNGIEPSCLPL